MPVLSPIATDSRQLTGFLPLRRGSELEAAPTCLAWVFASLPLGLGWRKRPGRRGLEAFTDACLVRARAGVWVNYAPLAVARPACRATAPGALWSSALHLLAPVAEGVL